MIDVAWDDQARTVIRIDFDSVWTSDDYADAFLQMLEMVEGTTHRLDLINTIGPNAVPPPSGMADLFHAALRQLPRQFVMIVTVHGGDRAAALTATLDHRMALTQVPFQALTADSLAQARAIIADDRNSTGNRTRIPGVESTDEGASF